MRLVVVTGTGTEVGKTWVTAGLARRLRTAGVAVAARKPAESYEPGTVDTDSQVLAAATGEQADDVCPPEWRYPVPMAPPMAADALGRPAPVLAGLAASTGGRWPAGVDVGLVEGAGGVRSPQAADGDTVDLIAALSADLVVLVADAGLGTINLVRLSTAALAGWPTIVFLNRHEPADPLHAGNRDWLRADGFEIVTTLDDLRDRVLRSISAGRQARWRRK